MASRIAEAYVQIVPRIDGVAASLNSQLSGPMGSAGIDSGAALGNGIVGSLKRLVGPAIAAFATVEVTKFFKEAITAGSNFQAEFEGVNQTFGSSAKIIQDYAKTAAKTAGMSEVEALRSAKSFGVFAKSAGLGGAAAATFSTDMVQLAGDLGSFNDVPTGEALAAIQSGLLGQSEPLRRFGVLLDDATLKARAMEMKIYDGNGALTAQQKVLAAQAEILAQTTLQQGDFIKYQNDFGNALKTTQSEFENVKKSVGVAFLPAMTSIVVAVRDNIIPVLKNMADALPAIFAKLSEPGGFVKLIQEGVGKLVAWIQGGGIAQIIQSFAQFRSSIFQSLASTLPEVISSLATALLQALPLIVQTLLTMIPQMLETAKTFFGSWMVALQTVIPDLIKQIVEMLPLIIMRIVTFLPQIIQAAVNLFNGLIQGLVIALPLIITALVEAIPSIIDAIVDALPLLIEGAFTLFTGIVTGIYKNLPAIIDAVIGLIPVIVTALNDSMPKIIDAGIQILKGLAKGIIDNAPKIIGAAINSLGDLITRTFKRVMGIASPSKVFAGFGVNIAEGLIVGMGSMDSAIKGAVTDMSSNLSLEQTSGMVSLNANTPIVSKPQILNSGVDQTAGNSVVNYYAAPNQSLDSEQALFEAMKRSKVVLGW